VTSQAGRPDPVESAGDLVPEARLVQMLVEGSEDALARLYDRHGDAVFAAAIRTSGDRGVAAEVVQDTFLALWNRAELFDPSRGSLRAWLMTIAHNRSVDHLRRASRRDRAATFSSFGGNDDVDGSTVEWLVASGEPVAAAGPEPGPELALSGKETRGSIMNALASLGPLEQSVIALAYDAGLSQSEIAVRLGWPIGTVKTRTRSALRHLRNRLEWSQGDAQAGGAEATVADDRERLPAQTVRSQDLGAGAGRAVVCPASFIPTTASCHA
jgi:RNA polymerase sigma-70 factor, ECF subfamily